MRVAFLGLGVMGFPMAGHLRSRGGHDVTVYNRTAAKAEAWSKQHGGQARRSPREAAKGAEIVFMCVGNDDDVRSIVYGEDGALAGMASGAILVDHTTASAELARELSKKAKERGVDFIDAPVSGGQAGAENGQLTVMCGGEEAAFARAKPVINSYAKSCLLLGPAGAGQLTKMVNQICIAGLVQGLAEGMSFGMKAGLDMEKVIAVISKGAAQSWQMDNRAKTMCPGQVRIRLRRRLDAQGPRLLPGRSQEEWGKTAGHRSGRSVLRPCPGARRPALGHLQPHEPADAGLRRRP